MSGDINYNAYSTYAKQYIDSNKTGSVGGHTPQQRIACIKKFLPTGTIFEIGSGEGLDAIEFQKQGFTVIPSDFTESFCTVLREKGFSPCLFDAKKDEIPPELQPLDGVYANAVFVHLSPEETSTCLQRIYTALRPGGIVFMSFILGEGKEVSGRSRGIEREFWYYAAKEVERIFTDSGFSLTFFEYPIDTKWVHIIGQK